MKKNIRQIKQELRNFARRGKEDRSPESDAFIDKVHTIKEALWGCLDVFDDGREEEIFEFFDTALDHPAIVLEKPYQHLYDVCAYLAGETDERPESLDVSRTCQEIEKHKSNLRKDFLEKTKMMVIDNCEEYFADHPEEIKSLKDPKEAQEWYDGLEDSIHDKDTLDWWRSIEDPLLYLAGHADLINRIDNTDTDPCNAEDWIAVWFMTKYGPIYFEQFRRKILGSEYTSPIEYYNGDGDINIDNDKNFTKKSGCHKHFSPLRKKNNSTRIGNFANNLDSQLIEAASNGRFNRVKSLVEQGADVNAKTIEFGWTALTWAAEEGHLDIVQFLVEKGADVNAKTTEGRTALILAAGEGHLDVVQFLVEKGADVNAQNKAGVTALIDAAEGGHLDVVKFLVENGSDVGAKEYDGFTPLMLAAYKGHLEVVQYLVENGLDVNAKDGYGVTALTLAAGQGHLSVVKYLVRNGADTRYCIGLAEKSGHTKVVRFLRRYEKAVENRTEREFWEEEDRRYRDTYQYNSW